MLRQTVNSEGWAKVLQPWLESKIKNAWLDPRSSNSQDQFFFQYTVAYGFAQAAQQILEFVDQEMAKAEQLTDKKDGKVEEKKFDIGGD